MRKAAQPSKHCGSQAAQTRQRSYDITAEPWDKQAHQSSSRERQI